LTGAADLPINSTKVLFSLFDPILFFPSSDFLPGKIPNRNISQEIFDWKRDFNYESTFVKTTADRKHEKREKIFNYMQDRKDSIHSILLILLILSDIFSGILISLA